ncbi:hypothetical protein P154DRAFT_537607 [Amniculicola lignicola CBS 123094]|uniref:Uncharacterized protein n=1 Tax=Amniculicola lignicola CBS 123094 TaxID=1392246 RepID=A0A6A5W6I0_9PLEO|nr:hypothetical protein P154DRAFT_537607 [Amniculicola lignicola CBS 123094]
MAALPPLLSVPSEIRLAIYKYLYLAAPLSSALGLLYSCRTINEEAVPEFIDMGKGYIYNLEKEYSEALSAPVIIKMPTSIRDYDSMWISLPVSGFLYRNDNLSKLNMDAFMSLPFKELRVELYIDKLNLRPYVDPYYQRMLDLVTILYNYPVKEWRRRQTQLQEGGIEASRSILMAKTLVFDYTIFDCPPFFMGRMSRYAEKLDRLGNTIRVVPHGYKGVEMFWN